MRRLYFILPCLLLALCTYAAGPKQGVVVDSENQPLIGVSVVYGGTTVITDFDGVFTIDVEENTELQFSLIGYQTTTQAAQDGMVVVLKKKGESADGRRMFIMANGAYAPTMNDYGVGLTIGAVKTFGAYTSFNMSPIGNLMKLPDNRSQWKTSDFLYSNDHFQSSHFSWTVGFVAGKTVYFYGGVGCGFFERYLKAYDLEGNLSYFVPVSGKENPSPSLAYEGGVLTNIKGFSLGVGVSAMSDFTGEGNYWNLKLSIGGNFSLRRK